MLYTWNLYIIHQPYLKKEKKVELCYHSFLKMFFLSLMKLVPSTKNL